MERRKHLSFEYYRKDQLCSKVSVDFETETVVQENFTDILAFQILGEADLTIDNVLDFFKERCFEEERADKDEILNHYGLEVYDPESICRITHGIMCDDDFWIKFDDDSISYEDIAKIKRW